VLLPPGLTWTVLLELPRSCPGLPRRAEGVKLERPQPRSGEDERAGRRQAAGDPRGRGRVGCGWGLSGVACVFPVRWLAEWSRKHPSGAAPVRAAAM